MTRGEEVSAKSEVIIFLGFLTSSQKNSWRIKSWKNPRQNYQGTDPTHVPEILKKKSYYMYFGTSNMMQAIWKVGKGAMVNEIRGI